MIDLTEFLLRLGAALIAGSIVGFERQWKQKSAGMRINTLVALGSCMFVLISISLTQTEGDVTRIIGQVVTGTGFLGAGVIMHEGIDIRGLTTAATIWCTSALGCLAGVGLYAHMFAAMLIVLSVNLLFQPIDNYISRKVQSPNTKKP